MVFIPSLGPDQNKDILRKSITNIKFLEYKQFFFN